MNKKTIIYYDVDKYYELWGFSAHTIKYKGLIFPTLEHAYQSQKHLDPKIKEEIRLAKSPLVAKYIANKKYGDKKRTDWEAVKITVMEDLMRAKATQHSEVKKALLRSGDSMLAELSEKDPFWGLDSKGHGQNHLGRIWMKIRNEYRPEKVVQAAKVEKRSRS